MIAGINFERKGRLIRQSDSRSEEEIRQFHLWLKEVRNGYEDEIKKNSMEIEALLEKLDPFDVIASLCVIEMGCNPETYKEWEHEGNPVAVEHVALLALKKKYNVTPTNTAVDRDVISQISLLAHEALERTQWFYVSERSGKIADPLDSKNEVIDELRFRSLMNSTFVRGHAYHQHLKLILRGIFEASQKPIRDILGFELEDAFAIEEWFCLRGMDRTNEKIQELSRCRDLIQSYLQNGDLKELTESPSEIMNLLPILNASSPEEAGLRMRAAFIDYTFAGIGESLSFTPVELAEVLKIPQDRISSYLEHFSVKFGTVDQTYDRPLPTHDLMTRPYLAHDGRFLRVAPDRYSALQARVEELLNPASPKSVNKNQKVWERYAKGRAKFTELKSLELLIEVLPKAIVEHGLKYYPDPEDTASIAELDGLIHFDTTLFLLEVKAGNVDDATRRGAPEKIKRDVGDLIGKACIQAARAEEYLRRTSTPRFIRPDGSVHLVDKNQIRKVFRICVTLDHMDPLNTMLFQTAQLGGFPDSNLPWVVSLRDLFVIAEMIEFPTQFLHYLVRRRRLNELGFIHAHDELDWFGHYLQEGLYFEEWVGKDVSRLNLLTYTTQFDEWYAFSEGIRFTPVEKPRMPLPERIRQIVSELESEAAFGYSEVALDFLGMSGDAMNQLISAFDKIRELAISDGKIHDASIVVGNGEYGITFFVGPKFEFEEMMFKIRRYIEFKKQNLNVKRWVGLVSVVETDRYIHGWMVCGC